MKSRPSSVQVPHYSKIALKNFRGFRNVPFVPLAPLTYLVGPNSSGKSSLFDALLLLTQSGISPGILTPLQPSWGGPIVDLGSYRDAVYNHNQRLKIDIAVEALAPTEKFFEGPKRVADHLHPIQISVRMGTRADDPIGRVTAMTATDPVNSEVMKFEYERKAIVLKFLGATRTMLPDDENPGLNYDWLAKNAKEMILEKASSSDARARELRRFVSMIDGLSLRWLMWGTQRVSSGRAAPKRWYPVTDLRMSPTRETGFARIIDGVDPTMLEDAPPPFPHFRMPKRGRPRVRGTLSSVLRDLNIASSIAHSKLSPYHNAIDVRDNVTGVTSNLIDVGYGASQAIPVIHACLSGIHGPLLIEQPEIHLHPKAQGTVADLLCRTSRQRQVIVETHSVHFINKARLLVARGDLAPNHVMVLYVDRADMGSTVRPIPILKNGDFASEWPGGFFDERYEDTLKLLSLKSRQGT